MTIAPVPIYTRADGTPLPGHPGPHPGFECPVSERHAWVQAKQAYLLTITDSANRAFADQFQRSVRGEER